jgi:hypothetical protein
MKATESDIQGAIFDALVYDGWLVMRVNQGAMRESDRLVRFAYWQALGYDESHAGISDIIAAKNGVMLCIEVKRPGKEATATQALFLEAARSAGNIGIVASSLEDIAPWLERVTV